MADTPKWICRGMAEDRRTVAHQSCPGRKEWDLQRCGALASRISPSQNRVVARLAVFRCAASSFDRCPIIRWNGNRSEFHLLRAADLPSPSSFRRPSTRNVRAALTLFCFSYKVGSKLGPFVAFRSLHIFTLVTAIFSDNYSHSVPLQKENLPRGSGV